MDISDTRLLVEPAWQRSTFDQAELAAVAYLARYSGRTLEAYRHDLKGLAPCRSMEGGGRAHPRCAVVPHRPGR
jgi:hypothetical protein